MSGHRGHYVPGPQNPTPIDVGTVLVSNQRVAFAGAKQTREWAFSKLIGFSHDPSGDWTAIQVSNRKTTSGIAYGASVASNVQARLAMALADYSGDRSSVVAELQERLDQLDRSRPRSPSPLA